MRPILLIFAVIVLLVAIYVVMRGNDRFGTTLQSANNDQADPVKAATTGPIDIIKAEGNTEDLARPYDELQPGVATVHDETVLSYSLDAIRPGLLASEALPNDGGMRESIDAPKLDDASRWIPRDWSLGSPSVTASVGLFYELQSDFDTVLEGNASISIRSVQPVEPGWTAGVVQIVDAETFRGQRIKYSGFLKTKRPGPESATSEMLWIRADDKTGRVVAFQNTIGQFVPQEAEWSEAAIVIDIPATASAIYYGASLIGGGSAWADRLSIEAVDSTYATTSTQYDKQTFNRVPNPERVLTVPSNLDFELVIPVP